MNETGIIVILAEVFLVLGGLVGFYAALKLHLRQKKCKKKSKPEGFDEVDISEDDELLDIRSRIPKKSMPEIDGDCENETE
ncbi:MAG: hypothetical protein IK990_20975 [Ruminiclostridium sp.]|nr:hypothetical protein [Ruminiclostridium sp.]